MEKIFQNTFCLIILNLFQKHVDQEWKVNKLSIITKQVLESSNPKEFVFKIVLGKINKNLGDKCLEIEIFDFLFENFLNTYTLLKIDKILLI